MTRRYACGVVRSAHKALRPGNADPSGGKPDRPMAAAASQFKTIVEQAMRDGDLSLSEAARRSGIERRRWYTYFTGEHAPGRVTLAKMARGLGVDYEVLAEPWGDPAGLLGTVTEPGGLAELAAAIRDLAAAVRGTTPAPSSDLPEWAWDAIREYGTARQLPTPPDPSSDADTVGPAAAPPARGARGDAPS